MLLKEYLYIFSLDLFQMLGVSDIGSELDPLDRKLLFRCRKNTLPHGSILFSYEQCVQILAPCA
jgi:hypothetical protein